MRLLPCVVAVCSACGFRVAGTASTGEDGGDTVFLDAPPIAVDAPPPVIDAPPDAPAGSPCANGVLDPGELDIDCGGTCATACTNVFTADANTLALFELNGNLTDSSGNGRNATLIGGGFSTTSWGMGFSVAGMQTQGLQWTAYANLLVHPYTIEMVIKPAAIGCYEKLVGGNDSSDAGWYYCNRVMSYQNQNNSTALGPSLTANQRHYVAFVTTSATQMTVYLNGVSIGSAPNYIANPPSAAIFFRDDTSTNRSEALTGVIDGIRISKIARTASEIAAVNARLVAQP